MTEGRTEILAFRHPAVGYLGVVQMEEPTQEWHFVLCRTETPSGGWSHRTTDGGGLCLEFFWHPLEDPPDENWHPVFRQALAFIRKQAARSG
jgi:hypothetical protein